MMRLNEPVTQGELITHRVSLVCFAFIGLACYWAMTWKPNALFAIWLLVGDLGFIYCCAEGLTLLWRRHHHGMAKETGDELG